MTRESLVRLGHLAPRTLLPLLRAVADLKRIRSARHQGSIAERLFGRAWGQIAAGQPPTDVARVTVRDALAATQLGDLDPATLGAAGVPEQAAFDIWLRAASEAAAGLDPVLRAWIDHRHLPPSGAPPDFVAQLSKQPRAGATCPGIGRLILEPPESHADHCLSVAIAGVLLASVWEARPGTVFLAALAHHLHNALLPDSGFAGEVLLGHWLEPATRNATATALAQLSGTVRGSIEDALCILKDVETPEGRAFHAADTLDRVLQVEHHLRAAGTTMDFVLRRMELVHAGPVKPFQDAVLDAVGLAA